MLVYYLANSLWKFHQIYKLVALEEGVYEHFILQNSLCEFYLWCSWAERLNDYILRSKDHGQGHS